MRNMRDNEQATTTTTTISEYMTTCGRVKGEREMARGRGWRGRLVEQSVSI